MARCQHENAIFVGYSGGYHFYAGEVWDNMEEEWYCPQCGRFLNDKEVHKLSERLYDSESKEVNQPIPF